MIGLFLEAAGVIASFGLHLARLQSVICIFFSSFKKILILQKSALGRFPHVSLPVKCLLFALLSGCGAGCRIEDARQG
jgi:hypothetical protein